MDANDLRLIFVAGLIGLGGLAVLVGVALSSLVERWRSDRDEATPAARRPDTDPGRREQERAVLFTQARWRRLL